MKRRIFTIATMILIIGTIFAKGNKEKEMTPDLFVNLYVQLSVAAEQYLDDSTKLVQVQDSIFNSFDVSRESFDKFREKMDKEPEKWNDLWQQIVKKLNDMDKTQHRDTTQKKSKEKSQKTQSK